MRTAITQGKTFKEILWNKEQRERSSGRNRHCGKCNMGNMGSKEKDKKKSKSNCLKEIKCIWGKMTPVKVKRRTLHTQIIRDSEEALDQNTCFTTHNSRKLSWNKTWIFIFKGHIFMYFENTPRTVNRETPY